MGTELAMQKVLTQYQRGITSDRHLVPFANRVREMGVSRIAPIRV